MTSRTWQEAEARRSVVASEFYRDLGRRIRARRLKKRLTLQDLADLSGLSKGFICAIELGRRGIGLEAALKLAPGLQVEFPWFVEGA